MQGEDAGSSSPPMEAFWDMRRSEQWDRRQWKEKEVANNQPSLVAALMMVVPNIIQPALCLSSASSPVSGCARAHARTVPTLQHTYAAADCARRPQQHPTACVWTLRTVGGAAVVDGAPEYNPTASTAHRPLQRQLQAEVAHRRTVATVCPSESCRPTSAAGFSALGRDAACTSDAVHPLSDRAA